MLSERDIADLYSRYGHAIFKRCLRLVHSQEDARELLQETFCQFVAGQAKFRGESSPFTFLYRIATNLSIDRLRRRRTAGDKVSLDDTPHLPSASAAPSASREVLDELVVLTEGFDEETLTIAVMSHVDEMTQDEIAELLDLSRKTVGKKLAYFEDKTRDRAGLAARIRRKGS